MSSLQARKAAMGHDRPAPATGGPGGGKLCKPPRSGGWLTPYQLLPLPDAGGPAREVSGGLRI